MFTYNGQALEIDENFVYLGTMFSYNGRFLKNNQRMVKQARKAMFFELRKSRKLQLPIDLQLQLFDSMIVPILLFGSEVTGFENSDILERLCTQFYKIILNVKKSTPNCILYGELGRYPISILIKSRIIGFWQRIVNGKQDKIAQIIKILLALHEGDHFHSKWLLSVKNCLILSDNQHAWDLQEYVPLGLTKLVKMKLIENYKQEWGDTVFNSSKCLNYRIFKTELEFEQYFNLLPNDLATAVCHFKSLNRKLRWSIADVFFFFFFFFFFLGGGVKWRPNL